MNPFRRAFTRAIKNPKFLLTALAVNLCFTVLRYLLSFFAGDTGLQTLFGAPLTGISLLITLALATSVHEGQPFSPKPLRRLKIVLLPVTLAYLIMSVFLSFPSYALNHLESFGAWMIPALYLLPLLTIVLLYFMLIPDIYAVVSIGRSEHALSHTLSIARHPLIVIGTVFRIKWFFFLLLFALLGIVYFLPVNYKICSEIVIVLFSPISSLLLLQVRDLLLIRIS